MGIGAEMVKQAGAVAWLIGIAALVAVTTWSGLDAVGHTVTGVGWGIFLVVMVRGVTVSVAGCFFRRRRGRRFERVLP